jgi:hypothetical protein
MNSWCFDTYVLRDFLLNKLIIKALCISFDAEMGLIVTNKNVSTKPERTALQFSTRYYSMCNDSIPFANKQCMKRV